MLSGMTHLYRTIQVDSLANFSKAFSDSRKSSMWQTFETSALLWNLQHHPVLLFTGKDIRFLRFTMVTLMVLFEPDIINPFIRTFKYTFDRGLIDLIKVSLPVCRNPTDFLSGCVIEQCAPTNSIL